MTLISLLASCFHASIFSNISLRFGVDFGGNKRGTVLRNLSPSKVKTVADSETRLQIDCSYLDSELVNNAADCCTE